MGTNNRYPPEFRQQVGEMYIYHGLTNLEELSEKTGVPAETLRRWRREDRWREDYEDSVQSSYAKTRENLLFVMHRMAEEMRKSMLSEDGSFMLPPENMELRVNRLSLAIERVAAMGSFIPTKQRLDVIKEIKEHAYKLAEDRHFTDEQILTVFKVLESFMDSLEIKKDS